MIQVIISRRNFLARTTTAIVGLLLSSTKTVWAARPRRLVCRGCKAAIKPEAVDEVICCPNCGREWWTGGFALKEAFRYRFPLRRHRPEKVCWDYAQVPFPNFQLLEKSCKSVLSLKGLKFSGRGTA